MVSPQKKTSSNPMNDIIWLKHLINPLILQRMLFFLSFVIYSIGDGMTAVHMMDKRGVISEINPVVRFVYSSSGGLGVISLKMIYAFIILFFVWRISKEKNTCWKVNGFLLALIIGSLMSIRANIMMASYMIPQSMISITFTFLSVSFFFIMIGNLMDKFHD